MPRQTKAFLISAALHCGLLLALIGIRLSGEPSTRNGPQILRVELVRMGTGAVSETDLDPEADGGAEAGDDVETELDGSEGTRPEDTAETTSVADLADDVERAEAVAEEAASDAATPDEPAPPRVAESDEDAADAPRTETVAAPPEESIPVDPAEATPPAPVERLVATGPIVPRPDEPVLPESSTPPEAETEPIPEAQRAMLDRKVEAWSESFVALGEWRPDTAWSHKGQEYTAMVTRLAAPDNMGIDEAIVAVSTERDGKRWSTEMRMKRLSFSHFAQLVDRWDPQVQIHDDEIDGRFHANSEIYVGRSGGVQPAFHGKVTTTRGINTSNSDRRIRRNEVFLGGLETRASRIVLPKHALSIATDSPADAEHVHAFATDTRVVFYPDGTYGWRELESDTPEQRRRLTDQPHYLVASDEAVLYLQGVVDGKVLVYSPEKIVIEGDLVYAAYPVDAPESDDYLGLVSDGSVEIAEPDTTGPGDLTVHAAIYARSRFVVRNYRSRNDGTLFILGSLSAGSVTATEPRFGTEITFDPRLEQLRPPGFPMTGRFEIAEWDGEWILDEGGASAALSP